MSQERTHGVNMLDVHVNMMGREGVLHPTLIVDGENIILVDTGLPGQLGTIREAMQPYCGGIVVVFTPGHTLGHLSLYVKETKTLIAGDALTIQEGGVLDLAPAANNHDLDLCKQSMKTLTSYDIEAVICYHGRLYSANVNQRIAELANS